MGRGNANICSKEHLQFVFDCDFGKACVFLLKKAHGRSIGEFEGGHG